jgi:ADP-ribosylglycohydrolase
MPWSSLHDMTPLQRAELSLEGLSIGDAFGQRYFGKSDVMLAMIERRALPIPPWSFTDDTVMAIGIVETLRERGALDQDHLADRFAVNFERNPHRGYGAVARYVLSELWDGKDWRVVAPGVFDGRGSYGNGGAMRVAPLGAYFADDIEAVRLHARRSAEVTHSHAEGQAGAVAIAAAAAWAWSSRGREATKSGIDMLDFVLESVPAGETKAGIAAARALSLGEATAKAASQLGNGSMVSSQDTVPLALWCAARHLDDFEAAMWATVSALGDRDTTCAMVGGIVALRVGHEGIPAEWKAAREPLTGWR